MMPPRQGVSHSEAIAAAYASAPEEDILLDTLEFLHPDVKDEDGNPTGIRVVNDHVHLMATLEADAPVNAGEEVKFLRAYFKVKRPAENDSGNPADLDIQIDNVAKILTPFISKTKESRIPITVIWRPYLLSDTSGPHILPVLTRTITQVSADLSSVTAKAGMVNYTNKRFPASDYTAKKFPGLTAR